MDDIQKELYFSFLVFQCNVERDYVYMWVDGSATRRLIRKDKFLEMGLKTSGGKLYPSLIDACNTYSFYLWNRVDGVVIHLTPKMETQEHRQYKDPIMKQVGEFKKDPMGKLKEIEERDKKTEKGQSFLTTILSGYGFEPPPYDSVGELVASLSLHDSDTQSFFGRLSNFFRKK